MDLGWKKDPGECVGVFHGRAEPSGFSSWILEKYRKYVGVEEKKQKASGAFYMRSTMLRNSWS